MPIADNYILAAVFGFLIGILLYLIFSLSYETGRLKSLEIEILRKFKKKLFRVPLLVEVLKDKVFLSDKVFADLLDLHEHGVLTPKKSVYDILEQNIRLDETLDFIEKIADKNEEAHTNLTYIKTKDYLDFLQEDMWKELGQYKKKLKKYNLLVRFKNLTIIGILIPFMSKVDF